MFGNGITNIIAAAIVALAIVWNGGFGGRDDSGKMSDEDLNAWYARAVGDIRNDIVVNCGCCGEGESKKEAAASF